MGKIDELLMFLLDGSWHAVDEAAKSLQTTQEKVEVMAKFLHEFGLVQFDRQSLRIVEDAKRFMEEIYRKPKQRI